MGAIYLSYSPQDRPLASKLAQALEQAGVEVFNQTEDDLFSKRLDRAMKSCNTLLLFWSRTARSCRSVERDWTNALIFDKKIVSLVLDDTALPAALLRGKLLDFRGTRRNWPQLLGSLRNGRALPAGYSMRNGRQPKPHSGLNTQMQGIETIQLRNKPLLTFSIDDVEEMLERRDYFDKTWHASGRGLEHAYEPVTQFGDQLVIDYKTGLMWQHAGSRSWMQFADAEKYIAEINEKYFGGYSDWRLPTLEEAMSLVEAKPVSTGLHISPYFGPAQRYIWTADKQCEEVVWFVAFPNGGVGSCRTTNYNSVRAVREAK